MFIFLATVAMETEWILRARYGWPRGQIEAAFRDIIDLPEAVAIPAGMQWALDRFAAGADFADMMHLSQAGCLGAFLTFDRRITPMVGDSASVAVITLT